MATVAIHCVVIDGSAPSDVTLARQQVEQPITWPIGDEGELHLDVVTQDGDVFDLADYTLAVVCRQHLADTDPEFAIEATNDATPEGGTAPGTAVVAMTTADTSGMVVGTVYWYDVRMTKGTESQQVVPMSKWTPGPVVARVGEPVAPPAEP